MIEEYFLQVEHALREYPNISSYALSKKIYNSRQGSIGGKIVFEYGQSQTSRKTNQILQPQ